MSHPRPWVLGGDLGGSNTRFVVQDAHGRTIGRGDAGGGNPVAHPDTAAGEVRAALTAALEGLDPARVAGAVVGMAGGSALRRPDLRATYAALWRDAGLVCPVDVRSDLEVAFAAGTAETSGTVLIAGTGAVAGRIEDSRVVATVDGLGWLIGDRGSGSWIGREAARLTAERLSHESASRAPAEAPGIRAGLDDGPDDGLGGGQLVAGVVARLGLRSPDRADLIEAVHARPPVRLADLTPVVVAAARAGDPLAVDVLARAVDLLEEAARGLPLDGPLVLAGGLAGRDGPLSDPLAERLGRDGRSVLVAGEAVHGACRLARRLATVAES